MSMLSEKPTLPFCYSFLPNWVLLLKESLSFNPLHSEWPKLHTILAILSAIGLKVVHILEGLHPPGKHTGNHKNWDELHNVSSVL